MNRRNLLSRGLLAALAFAAPITPLMAQQPDLSRKAVVDDPVAQARRQDLRCHGCRVLRL
jgi:hypothetical protein